MNTVKPIQAPEAVRGAISYPQDALPGTVVLADPTQVRRPWRATARTLFQALVALCTLVPLVVAGVYTNEADYPAAVVQALAVTSAVARVMAIPAVEAFLRQFLPFLAAAPTPAPTDNLEDQ